MNTSLPALRKQGNKMIDKPLLKIENLVKKYPIHGGVFKRVVDHLTAVSDVSFDLKLGETLGLVGESGCGKSTLGRAIIRLEKPNGGKIVFQGEDLIPLSRRQLREKRKDFQMIFQDPFSSLNPKMTVFKLLAEPIKNFDPDISRNELLKRVEQLMEDVGLRPEYSSRYPHEFSGGQRQRISIGRALAAKPKLVVCDEPVSALDVSIQAQILNLLIELQEKYGFSYVFISHDLHVVRHISHRIAVMYLGKFVEVGDRNSLYNNPLHPYTRALLSAVPVARTGAKKDRIILQGDVPSPINPPSGCYFHPRCQYATDMCKNQTPELKKLWGWTQSGMPESK